MKKVKKRHLDEFFWKIPLYLVICFVFFPTLIVIFPKSAIFIYFLGLGIHIWIIRYYYLINKKSSIKELGLITILQKEQRERKNILSKFGHEIRTPLSKIMGYAELLIYDLDKGTNIDANDLKTIHQSAKELLEVIKGINKYAMMEMSIIPLKKNDKIELNFILKSALESLSELIKYKDIKINYTEKKDIVCSYDGNVISRIYSSAMLTMIKLAMAQEIFIELKKINNYFLMSLTVEKIFLSKSEMENLYHPFDAPNTVSTNFTLGLEVYYCRKLLEQLEGKIILSCPENQRTILEVFLPLN